MARPRRKRRVSLLSARGLWMPPPAEEDAGGAPGAGRSPAVIRDLSLEVDRGEWVAVTGANGCGKTSLLLGLAGLWPARSGEVRLEGQPFGPRAPRSRRARVAVILQDPSCQLVQATVREELAFSALNLGRPRDEVRRGVRDWSEKLDLAADLPRDPQHLSAGRQQLVLLAAALLTRPALLLADEPAAHLDPPTRRRVLKLVRDEVALGLAVVWVTQDPEERAAADRIVDLAGDAPDGPSAAREEPPLADPLLILHVSPWDGNDGPRVIAAAPLSIPVAGRGITGIGGPNGVGKSVLLGAAVGLLRIDQVRVEPRSEGGRAPLLVAQYPDLEIFEERVRDEVTYAATSRGLARPEACEGAVRLFERLGLGGEEVLERRVWSLSGGEKRLLSLAGALLAPSGLLALDEPTAGLDRGRRAALARLVAEAAADRAVLVATQDREWISGLGARRFELGG